MHQKHPAAKVAVSVFSDRRSLLSFSCPNSLSPFPVRGRGRKVTEPRCSSVAKAG
jgi:hypothetical protein